METRKVQISGGSTFIVSLPKKWAEKNGITPGSPLNIIEDRNGHLIMSPKELTFKETISGEIKLTGKEGPEGLMRRLVGSYVSGVNNLIIFSKGAMTHQQVRTVREFTRLVMGVEIVEERKDMMKLQDLIDPADFSVKTGLKRMAYITERMVEDVLRAMEDLDHITLEDVVMRDIEVDRINWLIHKEYNLLYKSPKFAERSQVTFEDALNFMLTSRIVERVADHAVAIAGYLMKLHDIEDRDLLMKIIEKGHLARSVFSDSVSSLYSQDLIKADKVVDRSREIKEELEPMLKKVFKLPADEAVLMAYVINSLDRMASYGGDIGKITLNKFTPIKDEQAFSLS